MIDSIRCGLELEELFCTSLSEVHTAIHITCFFLFPLLFSLDHTEIKKLRVTGQLYLNLISSLFSCW